ncbi:MAG TPA: hypothetical protein PKX74_14640 [Leptospiraceae bacterium]|nr:hypothetical protein [Leptospiraceae bacterium]HMW58999.1 hypothetical protein [Leptospiraceae bacterium]HMY46713.1 hypothetical protein [Leptospiraceae bacterium]HNE24359.1 hypothetical protein [Leptospiraceae bacterium]HNJ04750.1 hypothetical protein [Leptospiraceae bacterium]
MELVLKYIGIGLGAALAGWGMFHQLIVGGAVSMIKHPDDSEARLFVMSWVAQGGFMSFLGVIPATLLLIYGPSTAAVHTVLSLSALALILLSSHVFLTGFKTHLRPIQIGASLELIYGIYLVILIVLS